MTDKKIVPTDEELAILAGATDKTIKRLAERRLEQRNKWREIDRKIHFNHPTIFRGANGEIIEQHQLTEEQLKELKKQPWWGRYCS